jgi:hypothetical protein
MVVKLNGSQDKGVIRMTRKEKRIWGVIGAGAVIVTAVGVYFLIRSFSQKSPSMRVAKVEAVIREAEELIKQKRK